MTREEEIKRFRDKYTAHDVRYMIGENSVITYITATLPVPAEVEVVARVEEE